MSERRQLNSHLYIASFRIEDAIQELREAKDYIDRYPFLGVANPGLRAQIQVDIDLLMAIGKRNFKTHVKG